MAVVVRRIFGLRGLDIWGECCFLVFEVSSEGTNLCEISHETGMCRQERANEQKSQAMWKRQERLTVIMTDAVCIHLYEVPLTLYGVVHNMAMSGGQLPS